MSMQELGHTATISLMTGVEMVVNLHITERCNYGCTYCFGKWGLFDDSSTKPAFVRTLRPPIASCRT